MMTSSVISWWSGLCAVAAFNLVAWSLSAVVLQRERGLLSAEIYAARRWQLLLSAMYVAGCAFRSVFPVYDVPRLCLFDSWLSSVIVGRSVATVAELCFVGQWALMLREISRATQSVVAKIASQAVVPLIAVAETCSWYSVLTTSNLGHVAEESIWGLSATLLVFSMLAIWSRSEASQRRRLLAWCVIGVAYASFMFLVDVPMYWARWMADQASHRHYLSIAQGLLDVSERRVVSHRWLDWKSEVAWMSLYFSVAVWLSISLIHTTMRASRVGLEKRKRLPLSLRYGIRTMDKPWF